MLSMDPLLCWLLGADTRGAQCCQGRVWVPRSNADNNKINWGQAVAGFIDSQPKSWLPAEVSAPSLNKGHLQFSLFWGLGTEWLLWRVSACLRAWCHRQADLRQGAVKAVQTHTSAGNAAFGQLNPFLCSCAVGWVSADPGAVDPESQVFSGCWPERLLKPSSTDHATPRAPDSHIIPDRVTMSTPPTGKVPCPPPTPGRG